MTEQRGKGSAAAKRANAKAAKEGKSNSVHVSAAGELGKKGGKAAVCEEEVGRPTSPRVAPGRNGGLGDCGAVPAGSPTSVLAAAMSPA